MQLKIVGESNIQHCAVGCRSVSGMAHGPYPLWPRIVPQSQKRLVAYSLWGFLFLFLFLSDAGGLRFIVQLATRGSVEWIIREAEGRKKNRHHPFPPMFPPRRRTSCFSIFKHRDPSASMPGYCIDTSDQPLLHITSLAVDRRRKWPLPQLPYTFRAACRPPSYASFALRKLC